MDKAQIAKYVTVAGGGYGLYWANKKYGWKMPPALAGALGAGVGWTLGNLLARLLTPTVVVQQQQLPAAAVQPQGGFGRAAQQRVQAEAAQPGRYLPPAQGGNGVRRGQTADDILADLGPLEGSFSDIDNSDDDDES